MEHRIEIKSMAELEETYRDFNVLRQETEGGREYAVIDTPEDISLKGEIGEGEDGRRCKWRKN